MHDSSILWIAAAALAFALFSLRAVRLNRRTVAQAYGLRTADDVQ